MEILNEDFKAKNVVILLLGWCLFCGICSYSKFMIDSTAMTAQEDCYGRGIVFLILALLYSFIDGSTIFEINPSVRNKLAVMTITGVVAFTLFTISMSFTSLFTAISILLVYFTIYDFSSCIMLRRNCKMTMILIIPAVFGILMLSNAFPFILDYLDDSETEDG